MIKQICFLLVLLGGYSVSMMAADKKEVYIPYGKYGDDWQ